MNVDDLETEHAPTSYALVLLLLFVKYATTETLDGVIEGELGVKRIKSPDVYKTPEFVHHGPIVHLKDQVPAVPTFGVKHLKATGAIEHEGKT